MVRCMRNINFSEKEVSLVLDQIAAILNLGNVEFAECTSGSDDTVAPTLDSKQFAVRCAELL